MDVGKSHVHEKLLFDEVSHWYLCVYNCTLFCAYLITLCSKKKNTLAMDVGKSHKHEKLLFDELSHWYLCVYNCKLFCAYLIALCSKKKNTLAMDVGESHVRDELLIDIYACYRLRSRSTSVQEPWAGSRSACGTSLRSHTRHSGPRSGIYSHHRGPCWPWFLNN